MTAVPLLEATSRRRRAKADARNFSDAGTLRVAGLPPMLCARRGAMFADATDRLAVTNPKSRPCSVPSITDWAPVALGTPAVLAAGALALAVLDLGPLSAHMAQHIALMNVLSPLAAILICASGYAASIGALREGPGGLWLAAALQVLLLWAWHLPSLQVWGMTSAIGRVSCTPRCLGPRSLFGWWS